MTDDRFEFDVALSFAGEDRDYVQDVAAALKIAGIRVFLDSDHEAEMWGENLIEFLDAVYRVRARYAMLFVSCSYAEKTWPRHERRSALARALTERSAYVLPVRLDSTDLPGLLPTVHYLDARRVGVDGIVRALKSKLAGVSSFSDSHIPRVPRDEEERQHLLRDRPDAWEYLYFAAILYSEIQSLEPKFRDHEIGYAAPFVARVDEYNAITHLRRAMDELQGIVRMVTTLLNPTAQEVAFGAPGEPGDPERIRHLAQRLASAYEAMLDWSARIRGTSRPQEFNRVFDLQAAFPDKPIREFREFVGDVVARIDGVPAALAAGERVSLDLTLSLTLDDESTNRLLAELECFKSEHGH